MRRDPLGVLLILLLIGSLGFVVWATRHPESQLLKKAEEWRLVGPLVEQFRARYLVEAPHSSAESTETHEAAAGSPEEMKGGVAARLVHDVVWVRVGETLHSEPDSLSPVVSTIPEVSKLPVLERDGDWYQILSRDRVAWVRLPDYDDGDVPPLGSEPTAPQPLPGRPPDSDLLALAVDLLDTEEEPARLGAYEFFSDFEDDSLMRMLEGVASNIERTYAERYGVRPIDRPREAIVLFELESDYRSLQSSVGRIADLPAVGLVSQGVVAIYVGRRDRQEVASTLVHELVHLLSRRALGPALPPWLDEGLADDLAFSEIGESGQLRSNKLGGSAESIGSIRVWKGGRAAVLELQRALTADRALPLEELLSLDWRSFVEPEMELHYPQSALLVRYLVESEAALQQGFRAYLEGIAGGGSVAPDALLRHLGRSWVDLEAGFRDWAVTQLVDLP